MALLLKDIPWGEPVLPAVSDPEWETEIKRRGGHIFDSDRRIAPSPWLREAALSITTYRPTEIPDRLMRIGNMVTAQENACRYCYGANRAYLKVLGYSEAFIAGVERDVQLAELNEKERGFITFCRNLARSRPRPSRAASEHLVDLGYAPRQIKEMAFLISMGCFYNRVSTMIACPPEDKFERLANGPVGRLLGIAAPVIKLMQNVGRKAAPTPAVDMTEVTSGRFGPVLAPIAELPAAAIMKSALDGAFASEALSCPAKGLMFAVVARTLGCSNCEREIVDMLRDEGLTQEEITSAISLLRSPRLEAHEADLLSWARDTVYYDTRSIQQKTRALGGKMGNAALLEAIGVASLANGTVRLAMLLE